MTPRITQEKIFEKSYAKTLIGIAVPLVHDLGALVAKLPAEMNVPFGYELGELNNFATTRRYQESSDTLTQDEAKKMIAISLNILDWSKKQIQE